MPLFLVRERESNARVFQLSGQLVYIGRAEASDLVLPNTAVGRRHAKLQRQDGAWILEDLGSPNGTLVNDKPHTRGPLEHGDVVRIVRFRLEYLEEDKFDDAQKRQVANLRQQTRAPLSGADATFAMTPAMRKKLLEAEKARDGVALVSKGSPDRSWRPEGRPLSIGPGGDVPAKVFLRNSPAAILEWKGSSYAIKRQGLWGTLQVNGKSVKEGPVRVGDTIRVGSDEFELKQDL